MTLLGNYLILLGLIIMLVSMIKIIFAPQGGKYIIVPDSYRYRDRQESYDYWIKELGLDKENKQ